MIDDDLLDLVADCYVALRANGYLGEFPTFESFVRRALGPERSGQMAPGPARRGLADLAAAPAPESVSAN